MKKMLDKLKQAAMTQGFKLIQNPKVMKVMADPRVMKVVMQAFSLSGKVKHQASVRAAHVAKSLGLATKEEVASLKSTIRTLENTITSLEQKVEDKGRSRGASAQAPA
jgi:hypothetical protein